MSPRITQAEGRERNAPADRQAELVEIAVIARELTLSEGSTTSSHFDRWCEIEQTAEFLLTRLECSDLKAFLAYWVPEARRELQLYLIDEPEVTP